VEFPLDTLGQSIYPGARIAYATRAGQRPAVVKRVGCGIKGFVLTCERDDGREVRLRRCDRIVVLGEAERIPHWIMWPYPRLYMASFGTLTMMRQQ
jgi:hypothetical protein